MTYDEAQRASRQRFEDDLRRAQSMLSLTDSERRALDYMHQRDIWREAALQIVAATHVRHDSPTGPSWRVCIRCAGVRDLLTRAERQCAKLEDDNDAA